MKKFRLNSAGAIFVLVEGQQCKSREEEEGEEMQLQGLSARGREGIIRAPLSLL